MKSSGSARSAAKCCGSTPLSISDSAALEAITNTLAFIRTTGTPALVVLNAIAATGQDASLAEEALSSHNVETCPVRLGRRVAFARSLLSGQTAQEFEPMGKASHEVARLHDFIAARLQDFNPSTNGTA